MDALEDRKRRFARQVVSWEIKNSREFPWRHKKGAYNILIAEFLLKRTTSKAARGVYLRFLEKFPTIDSLARAKSADIEQFLKPIGLYKQRSRGLKEAAHYIVTKCNSRIPNDYDRLLEIPHVGQYTAGAVLSFGFGRPAPIVDSNVKRVVTRVFFDVLGDKPSDKRLRDFLSALVPRKTHKLFNWGLLDLGFLICSYQFQKHEECPLKGICFYYKGG